MTVIANIYERVKGGWKTVGASGVGAFNSDAPWAPRAIGANSALTGSSAYFACLRLLSETLGSLTFQLYDDNNNIVKGHDLYDLMRYSPNQYQSGDIFVGSMAANMLTFGNAMSHIKRHRATGKPYMLDFYTTDLWDVSSDAQGRPTFKLDGTEIPASDVLHWQGFGLSGYWGMPMLLAAGETLSLQMAGNTSASQVFSNGLRAGGFFTLPENRQAFTDAQLVKFNGELARASRPENSAKWLPLLPGMGAIANQQFRVDPVTAELLQSRYFSIEEVCRYLGVPPPLIGHTDKASSWASSLENLNQFLVDYTLLPKTIRFENQIGMKLLGRNDRIKLRPKYNMDALLRGDIAKRFATYDIGIKNKIYSPNDARALENMPPRDGGDEYSGRDKPAVSIVQPGVKS